MPFRLLLGVLVPILSGYRNESTFEKAETLEKDFQTPAKFHTGMLSISLITGLVFGGFITYKSWKENNTFLSYIRNLVIALVCRTFFSILFDGVILLGEPLNVAGGNALLAFEQIFLNLVLAFWLTLTIYIHARVKKNFDREPTIRLYQYGVPGVAVFFAFVWIFTLQDQVPSMVWWIILGPFTQWIVNSLNLLFLLIQLALVGDIVRMMMKMSLDNDSISLLRYVTITLGVLVLIFWLQFGFILGRVPLYNSAAYLYFHYFVDGSECALVCLVLYFFSKWVFILLKKISSLMIGNEETSTRTSKSTELLLNGHGEQRIETIDSVFMTNESKRWNVLEKEGMKDVVYSNVVEPQRLKKTLELYKRFDIIPTNRVTVVEGEEFYDCQMQSSLGSSDCEESKLMPKHLQTLQVSKPIAADDNINFRNDGVIRKQSQKKNAFYSSKYLILDSKESDFSKYLETRPSVSSISGKDSLKEGRINKDLSSSLDPLMSVELVRKWLLDNSKNMRKNEKYKTENCRTDEKEKRKASRNENLNVEMPIHKFPSETSIKTEDEPRQKENQVSTPQTIVSTIGSVMSNSLFRLSKSEKKNSDKEKNMLSAPGEIKTAESEQNDAIKFVEMVPQSEPETAEFQKKSDISDDTAMDTYINMESKGETAMNLKEDEKLHSKAHTKVIQTFVDVSGESLQNLTAETKEDPEKFEKISTKLTKDQKLKLANDIESISKEKNNPDIPVQPAHPEFCSQLQLIIEQQPQVSKLQLEKLTGFLRENQHHKDPNLETENKNICESLNVESETKELESLETQKQSATVRTESTDINEDVTRKPLHDLKLGSELVLSENELELTSTDWIRKPKSTELAPSDVQNSNKPTECLDQYITYSELLNFRSQREKETDNQPSFSFSDAVFFAIDSLINASNSFFFPKKNYPDEENIQKVEAKKIEKSNENIITNNYQAPQDKVDEKLGNVQGPKNNSTLSQTTPYLSATHGAEDEKTRVLGEAFHGSKSELNYEHSTLKQAKLFQ